MSRKSGSVRKKTCRERIEGRARSERRVRRGPSPSLGAAIRVRLHVLCMERAIGPLKGRNALLRIMVERGVVG